MIAIKITMGFRWLAKYEQIKYDCYSSFEYSIRNECNRLQWAFPPLSFCFRQHLKANIFRTNEHLDTFSHISCDLEPAFSIRKGLERIYYHLPTV